MVGIKVYNNGAKVTFGLKTLSIGVSEENKEIHIKDDNRNGVILNFTSIESVDEFIDDLLDVRNLLSKQK